MINNLEYTNPAIGKIVAEEYQFDEDIGLTRDDSPLAELYDYHNWQEWGGVSRKGLKSFLP